eukprot:803775_1
METFSTSLTCTFAYILSMLTLLLPSHILASYDYNNWIAPSSPTLSRDIDMSAVGYDSSNNTIWILGGYPYNGDPQSLISYDIVSNLFTDYTVTALSDDVWGWGDFYTQIDDILYMIDPLGEKLSTFNVNTAQFTYYYQNIDIPLGALNYGCLASIDDALFVLGAGPTPSLLDPKKHVQVLNLTTRTWIVSPEVDYLNQSRTRSSCIVHPYNNALYAIGGYTETIEKLYVGDLAHLSQYNWEFIDSLPHPISHLRSVVYENDIVSIGGYNSVTGARNEVFVIDVTSDTVRLSGFMAFDCQTAGFILARNVLYSFGGSKISNQFQYLNMSEQTHRPTADPTLQPSTAPTTASPTEYPSASPTTYPSTSPTIISALPTKYPSIDRREASTTEEEDTPQQLQEKSNTWVFIAIGAAVMCVFGILYVFIRFRKQRNNQWVEDQVHVPGQWIEYQVHVPGENNVDLVKIWLESTVGLAQYYATFIANDYNSLDFISNISSKEALSEIGIKSKGHQNQLMAHIKKLKDAEEPMIQETEGVNENQNETKTAYGKTKTKTAYVTKSEEGNGKTSRLNDVCDV